MVDAKQAIEIARNFLVEVYGSPPDELRLEEVDSTDDFWLITLGFNVPAVFVSPVRAALGTLLERQYKVFAVNKTDGHVQSMKIRQVG